MPQSHLLRRSPSAVVPSRTRPRPHASLHALLVCAAALLFTVATLALAAQPASAAGMDTGIYRDPAGGLGACITPDGMLAAGRYHRAGEVHGAGGTWAWEFDLARATPAGARWPEPGVTVGGPLAGARDNGPNAGASLDQAANIVDPDENYLHRPLDHTGALGPRLARFAERYPGPWMVRLQLDGDTRRDTRLITGGSYHGTVTVVAGNGREVPVSGLPVSVSTARPDRVRLTSRTTTGGRDAFTVTPQTAGHFQMAVTVRELAPTAARLTIPDGGRASGYQFLLQATAPGVGHATLERPVAPAGYRLWLRKVNLTTGRPVAGAVLSVVDLTTHRRVGEVTTHTTPVRIHDPWTASGNLDPADTYEVTEVRAPAGYYIPVDRSRVIRPRHGRTTITVTFADPVIPHPRIGTEITTAGSTITASGPLTTATGNALGDAATVSGDDGEAGTITATLESVTAPADGSCTTGLSYAGATTLATRTIALNPTVNDGNGTYMVSAVPLTTAGRCVTWVESLTLQPSGATVTTAPGAATESVLVIAPSITTVISARRLTTGAAVHDDVRIVGAYGHRVTVAGTLLGPARPEHGSCRAVSWSGVRTAARISSVTFSREVDRPLGDSRIPVAAPGCYTYAETVTTAVNVGRADTTRTVPGAVSETALVTRPTVATVSQHAVAGHRLRDRIRIGGLAGVTIRVTAELLEAPARDGECGGVRWHGARVLGTTSALVHGNGLYVTRPLGPAGLIDGRSTCTTFVESATLGRRTVISTRPGLSSETQVLRPRLQIISGSGAPRVSAAEIRWIAALILLGLILIAVRRLRSLDAVRPRMK